MSRRIVIGAFGGDQQRTEAKAFGEAVGRTGCILLTGGKLQLTAEVKDTALYGANSVDGQARLVGILPSEQEHWDIERQSLFLGTGLSSPRRNVINALTPDVVVLFGGGGGTLAEAAFALGAGKPVLSGCATLDQVRRLQDNLKKYFTDIQEIEKYFYDPIQRFPGYLHGDCSEPSNLIKKIAGWLERAIATPVETYPELIEQCMRMVPPEALNGQTGFPGLPELPVTKDIFEAVIRRISMD